MRQFIRHPVSIPIEVRAGAHAGGELHHAGNLSLGGLEFDSDAEIAPGSLVEVRIPFVEPAFTTCGRVAWCRCSGDSFQLGVQFLDARRGWYLAEDPMNGPGKGLFETEDGGKTWRKLSSLGGDVDQFWPTAFWMVDAKNGWIVDRDGRVLRYLVK